MQKIFTMNRLNIFYKSGHPQGEHVLRVEIARYLYQSRGIYCSPEQIVIGSGTEQLLPMILRLLDEDAKFALENPGYSANSTSSLAKSRHSNFSR